MPGLRLVWISATSPAGSPRRGYRCPAGYCRNPQPEKPKRPPSKQHGTAYRYRLGCRCDDCREGYRAWMRDYRAKQRAKRTAA